MVQLTQVVREAFVKGHDTCVNWNNMEDFFRGIILLIVDNYQYSRINNIY